MLAYNLTFCGASFLEIPVSVTVDSDGDIAEFAYENGATVRNPRLLAAMRNQLQEEIDSIKRGY